MTYTGSMTAWRCATFAICAFWLLAVRPADATTAVRFNYQARLTDTAGVPLQGGHTLHLSVWTGGTSTQAGSVTKVYSETAAVTIIDGVVNHSVGTGTSAPGPALAESVFATTSDLFLQVGIDSAANVVLPRVRLEPVPLAVRALNGLPAGTMILSAVPAPTYLDRLSVGLRPRLSAAADPLRGRTSV